MSAAVSSKKGTRSARGLGDGPARARRHGLAGRPGEIAEAEPEPLVELVAVGTVGDHRRGGREQRAVGGQPHHDERDEQPGRAQEGKREADSSANSQRQPHRSQPSPLVGEAAGERGEHGLQRGRPQERPRDDGRTGSESAEAQRREHVDDAEGHAGETGQPHPAGKATVAQGPNGAAQALGLAAGRRRRRGSSLRRGTPRRRSRWRRPGPSRCRRRRRR